MKVLYAPWRKKYIDSNKQKKHAPHACVFCFQISDNNDQDYFILKRFKHNVVIMNLYPYSNGHLMVIPKKHVSDLSELTQEERSEMIALASASSAILKKCMNSEGVNIGINMGKAAGAGMPEHLHMHLVPRWLGDTGFLSVFDGTKVLSADLKAIYNLLKPEFDKLNLKA